MFVIHARNPNDALAKGIKLIKQNGEKVDSRNGPVLELPRPCATVYSKPWERVLISSVRDANPFFHLMESIWILAGREDVKFLNEFNKRMVDYSDNGKTFNAPYGHRMRVQVGAQGSLLPSDQLARVIELLKEDPGTRQAVIQIWSEEDLYKSTKDKPCNMSIAFRVRQGKLCITVYNRSNDMIWGACGANVVQFSMIQEYVAAHLGLQLGEYTQITNSYHVYTTGPGGELWDKLRKGYGEGDAEVYDHFIYNLVQMSHSDMRSGNFEHDLKLFFNTYDRFGLKELGEIMCWRSSYFIELVLPVLCVFIVHKTSGASKALSHAYSIQDDAWRMACSQWLSKRVKR